MQSSPMGSLFLQHWALGSDFPLFLPFINALLLVSMLQTLVLHPDGTKDCLTIKDVQTRVDSSFLWYLDTVVILKASQASLLRVFLTLALSAGLQGGKPSEQILDVDIGPAREIPDWPKPPL